MPSDDEMMKMTNIINGCKTQTDIDVCAAFIDEIEHIATRKYMIGKLNNIKAILFNQGKLDKF